MTENSVLSEPIAALGPSGTAEMPGATTARARWARSLLRQPRGFTAVTYLALLVLAGLLASSIAPFPPDQQSLSEVLQGPSTTHLLGTDTLGRDVLSRLLYGIIPSLQNSLIALVVFLVLGIPVGIIAGYRGGRFDAIVGRVTELMLAVPPIILVLVVLGVFSSSPSAAMVTLAVLAAPGLVRVVRGATLVVREELFVTAAKVAGVRNARIMATHILRRVLGPILAQATVFAGVTLGVQAALAFLGLLSSDSPTWGGMIGEASTVITETSWLLIPPGVILAVTVLALGLLGDTIRDLTSGEATNSARPSRRSRRAAAARRDAQPASKEATAHERTPTLRPGEVTLEARSSALLEVRHLAVTTAGPQPTTLVDDATFVIHLGEVVGVVGESGCGKSVTALAVLGLLPEGLTASAGEVIFQGTDLVAGGPAAYRAIRGSGIGYVAQDALGSLDPTHTIGSQLMEVIAVHDDTSHTQRRTRAIELLEQVKIPDPERVLRTYPHEISGGMAQRVNIAIALAGRPQLLVADEPTTALDVTVQGEILRLLRELQQSTQMAVLLITHDWGVIAGIADRAVVMYAGEVVERADVQTLFTHPRFPYTAALLAAEPSLAAESSRLPTLPGRVPPPGSWPTGCRFASRCTFARDQCTRAPIPLLAVSGQSDTRCIRIEELVSEGAMPR
ncbi:dipeptide/oligopeptide/nickel ABC transporter permease/ATP-binding protein [Terrabacter sp. Root85]|uniref:dipeptide/oligopeptide/nickel ABC transporter permease/ATP-binding protein n=1 Tax=Terrabacter sp. Root85 TaxID=1736603 RepID=UPI000AFF1A30|nr:dipeptide/oligopeptide/nickel ABC transporter permease/ATP-binding protein [Terrabacter sp. Root85]